MKKRFFVFFLILVVAVTITAQPSIKPDSSDVSGVLYFRKLIAGRVAIQSIESLAKEANSASLPKTIGSFRRIDMKKLSVESSLLSTALTHGIECSGFYWQQFQPKWKGAYYLAHFKVDSEALKNKDKFVSQFNSATRTRAWELFDIIPSLHNMLVSLRVAEKAATGVEKKLSNQYLMLQKNGMETLLVITISSGVMSYMSPIERKGLAQAIQHYFSSNGKNLLDYGIKKADELKGAKAWSGGFFYSNMEPSMKASVGIICEVLNAYGYKVYPLTPPKEKETPVKTT